LIIVSPHYENGTNDEMPAGRDESHSKKIMGKMYTNQAELKANLAKVDESKGCERRN
jgi:hypothetical protein